MIRTRVKGSSDFKSLLRDLIAYEAISVALNSLTSIGPKAILKGLAVVVTLVVVASVLTIIGG